MPRTLAILAEPDLALRHLMLAVLKSAQYEVRECSNRNELKAELAWVQISGAECSLIVLNATLATSCTAELAVVACPGIGANAAPVIVTCELGALGQAPNLDGCRLAGVLEKPFDLDEFERLARACTSL